MPALSNIETAASIGGQRRGHRARAMLRAVRSGVVIERDGSRHRVVAGRDYWHPEMLKRMRSAYVDWFDAVDMTQEMRNARSKRSRRTRRSRRSGRSPIPGSRPKTWKLP
jgi:hypothetical protein